MKIKVRPLQFLPRWIPLLLVAVTLSGCLGTPETASSEDSTDAAPLYVGGDGRTITDANGVLLGSIVTEWPYYSYSRFDVVTATGNRFYLTYQYDMHGLDMSIGGYPYDQTWPGFVFYQESDCSQESLLAITIPRFEPNRVYPQTTATENGLEISSVLIAQDADTDGQIDIVTLSDIDTPLYWTQSPLVDGSLDWEAEKVCVEVADTLADSTYVSELGLDEADIPNAQVALMEEISLEEAGLPATIELPLTIQ